MTVRHHAQRPPPNRNRNRSFNVITGIGLNVNNRQPTTCLDELLEKAAAAAAGPAAAAGAAAGAAAAPLAPLPREVVLAEILKAMEDVFNVGVRAGMTLTQQGPSVSVCVLGPVLMFRVLRPTCWRFACPDQSMGVFAN